MKSIILLAIILLTSCGYSTPKIGSKENPFIVYKILPFKRDTSCVKYICLTQRTATFNLESERTAIIAPKKRYNIGDTIK